MTAHALLAALLAAALVNLMAMRRLARQVAFLRRAVLETLLLERPPPAAP